MHGKGVVSYTRSIQGCLERPLPSVRSCRSCEHRILPAKEEAFSHQLIEKEG